MSDNRDDVELSGCLLALLATPFLILLRGICIQLTWGWFLTPTFSVAAPTMLICVGLSYFAELIHPTPTPKLKSMTGKYMADKLVQALSAPALGLLFAYIIHLLA